MKKLATHIFPVYIKYILFNINLNRQPAGKVECDLDLAR